MTVRNGVFFGIVLGAGGLVLLAPKAAHSQAATAVQVVNSTSSPVPNRDVDHPGRHVFLGNCVSRGGIGCTILAPPDRRVVVQYLNAGIFSGKGCDEFVLQQVTDVGDVVLHFPCVPAGKDTAIAQGPITFFIEPGFALLGHSIPALPSDGELQLTLTGYTIAP